MNEYVKLLLSAVVSAGVVSAILGAFLVSRTARIQEEIKRQFAESLQVASSRRQWKERAVAELLGPVVMQFDRTGRAFARWKEKNLFLESEVIRVGNVTIRDLLLTKGHLIPPELLTDAGLLVEHYDRWLEEFERLRKSQQPAADAPFTFAGPQGYPFPREAERRLREAYQRLWNELYGTSGATQPPAPRT